MKKLFVKIMFLLIIPILSIVGTSSWVIIVDKANDVNLNENVTPVNVCYINSDVDGNRYTSIERALQVAKSGDIVHVYLDSAVGAKTIRNDCVVKKGVTLNISHDGGIISKNDSGIMVATKTSSKSTYTVKNTVIISEGINITNYGKIFIGGILNGGAGGTAYTGHTSDEASELIMNSNSKIESYGEIWSCGYIKESSESNGSLITCYSGTIEAPFVVRDFRGGSQTYAIYNGFNDYNAIFYNQFEVKNIQPQIRIKYNATFIAYANIYIQDQQSTTIKLIGNNSDSFLMLTDSNCYVDYKYNANTEVANYDFYGGLSFNNLNLALKFYSIFDISLSTNKVYFPLSWRMQLTLNKYPGQVGIAEYTSSAQKIKMLPGHKLVINEGCKFTVPNMNVYSHFGDWEEGSLPAAGTPYGKYSPAEFIVKGKFECKGAFGGRIIYASNVNTSSDIVTNGDTLTTYEPYSTKSSFSLGDYDLLEIDKMLVVKETKTLVSLSNFENNKTFAIGVNQTTGNSGLQSIVKTVVNGVTNEYQSNRIMSYAEGTSIRIDLINNITKATWNKYDAELDEKGKTNTVWNADAFIKNTDLLLDKSCIFVVDKASSDIGNVKVSGITISGDSKVAIGNSVTLSATINNLDKAYTKSVYWESSDSTIATINSNGIVTGLKKGAVTITAYSNDGDKVSSSIIVNVFDPNASVKLYYYGIVTNGIYDSTAINGTAATVAPGDEITLNSDLEDRYILGADKNGTADSVQNWYKFSHWNVTLVNSDGTEISSTMNSLSKYTIPDDFNGQTIKITGVYNTTPAYYKYKLVISGTYQSISSSSGIVNGTGTYWVDKDDYITVSVKGSKGVFSGTNRVCTISGTSFSSQINDSDSSNTTITSKGTSALGTPKEAIGYFYMADNYVSLSTN